MEYTNYLVHHGILGQKWGIRNGPPYPLSEKKSSRHTRRNSDKENSDREKNKKSSLTEGQKKAIKIAIGVGLGIASAYATYQLANLIADKKVLADAANYLNPVKVDLSKEEILARFKSINVAPMVDARHAMNCPSCTMATEFAFRGADNVGATSLPGATPDEIIKRFGLKEDGWETSTYSDLYEDMYDKLSDLPDVSNMKPEDLMKLAMPDLYKISDSIHDKFISQISNTVENNSHGVATIVRSDLTGHVFNWFKDNKGEVFFYDAQINNLGKTASEAKDWARNVFLDVQEAGFFETTNVTLENSATDWIQSSVHNKLEVVPNIAKSIGPMPFSVFSAAVAAPVAIKTTIDKKKGGDK